MPLATLQTDWPAGQEMVFERQLRAESLVSMLARLLWWLTPPEGVGGLGGVGLLQHWLLWSQEPVLHVGVVGWLGSVGTQHSKPPCHCQLLGQPLLDLIERKIRW